MAHAKQASKQKRRRVALPILGAAGASLAMGGGASATVPIANVPSQDNAPLPVITLDEEEISDVIWRRSMSSTRKVSEHPNSSKKLPDVAEAAAEHEPAEAAQHEPAEAAQSSEAAEAVEAAEAAEAGA